ncbi:hypothetical protein [Panacibacter ginsenosidivorans]|uniref:hypothetical protein n=1 Tax=Panacibacter ginsenosidivorans TaxID=1813871 RepID=UPI0013151F3A|nr:hypothetical protein [Panacibacter ginsenosidivorans]
MTQSISFDFVTSMLDNEVIFTVVKTESVIAQMLSVITALYIVVTSGVATVTGLLLTDKVFGGYHAYSSPPDAVIVTDSPLQTPAEGGSIANTGNCFCYLY